MNIYQKKKKLNLIYKKEFIPILLFLINQGLIYKYIFLKQKYIIIFFKTNNSFNFFKKIKIFNFKNHEFKKYLNFIFIKQQNMFKYSIVITNLGIFSIDQAISKKLGGFLISHIN